MSITTRNRLGGQLPAPGRSTMLSVGQAAVRQIKERTAQAVDVNDAPAKPLTRRYAQHKSNRGAQPIRNARLTGATLEALSVTESDEDHVSIGFTDGHAAAIAAKINAIDQMIGLSGNDRREIISEFKQKYIRHLKNQ